MNELIQKAAQHIAKAKRLVISTGAGVSRESGVPTFRDALDGLWAKYDPTQLGTPDGFKRDPKLVWDWFAYRRDLVEKSEPNPGHYALAELEKLIPHVVLVTQNVDNLHQRAGNQNIVTLHGNLFAYKCFDNCRGNPTSIDINQLTWKPDEAPPRCPYCNAGYVRPDVVWFGELLPEGNLARAYMEADTCDVMIIVGTSGVVYPAAWLPIRAKLKEAILVEINPNPTELTPRMDVYLPVPSGQVLPQIIDLVKQELKA